MTKSNLQNRQSKSIYENIKNAVKNKELKNCDVYGRLGDLATIDSKYDVAITTAYFIN